MSTVAHNQSCDALVDLGGRCGRGFECEVGVRVEVDESGRDDTSRGIDGLSGTERPGADRSDPATVDGDIGTDSWRTGSVD
jgi:hypothetical protein